MLTQALSFQIYSCYYIFRVHYMLDGCHASEMVEALIENATPGTVFQSSTSFNSHDIKGAVQLYAAQVGACSVSDVSVYVF